MSESTKQAGGSPSPQQEVADGTEAEILKDKGNWLQEPLPTSRSPSPKGSPNLRDRSKGRSKSRDKSPAPKDWAAAKLSNGSR